MATATYTGDPQGFTSSTQQYQDILNTPLVSGSSSTQTVVTPKLATKAIDTVGSGLKATTTAMVDQSKQVADQKSIAGQQASQQAQQNIVNQQNQQKIDATNGLTAAVQGASGIPVRQGQNGVWLDANGMPTDAPQNATVTNGVINANPPGMPAGSINTYQGYQDFQNKVGQIQNGTFPLTPTQQALLDSTKAMYDQLRFQQQKANSAYEGGINTAEIASGRSEHFREIAAGDIKAAMDQGVQKITEIDQKATTALANLQSGFQSDDLKAVTDSWNEFQQYASQKNDTLVKLQEDSQKALQDQRDYDFKAAQANIENQLNQDKFDAQKAMDTVDMALKNAQITKEKADTYKTQIETKQLQDQVNGTGTGLNVPAVSMMGSGTPSKSQQLAFLNALPGGANGTTATMVKGLVNYQTNPASFSTSARQSQGGLTRSQAVTLAQQFDPTYDETQFAARQAMRKSVTSGTYSQSINSANLVIQHLDALAKAAKALHNTGFPITNQLVLNPISRALGQNQESNFNTARDAVASELAKVFKGTGSTSEDEINMWRNNLSASSSPSQIQGAINMLVSNLLKSRLDTINSQYTNTMGKTADFTILTPHSRDVLQGMGVDPNTIEQDKSADTLDELWNSNNSPAQSNNSTDLLNSILNQ